MQKSECKNQLKAYIDYIKERVQMYDIDNKRIMIFGAGNTSKLYNKCFQTEQIAPEAYLDNNAQKIGTMFLGKRVVDPNTIQGEKNIVVFICSDQPNVYQEISAQLKELGVTYLGIQEYVVAQQCEKFLSCLDVLDDDESIEIYTKLLLHRLTGTFITPNLYSVNPYFAVPWNISVNPKEVFVDCGAFVGDTVEQYIWTHLGTFGKIFAFEPEKKNYVAMQERIKRLNKEWALSEDSIIPVNAGVGVKRSCLKVGRDFGLGAMFEEVTQDDEDGDMVNIYSLDEYFHDQKIDFLKADIESYEYDMLKGAEQVLRRDRPRLAICIYHNISDMYQIILWLHSCNLHYKFSIRHHSVSYAETVLYAYPQ